jgi:hypothetical protein
MLQPLAAVMLRRPHAEDVLARPACVENDQVHRGRPWDAARYRRVTCRTTLTGEGPTADPPFAQRTSAWAGIITTISLIRSGQIIKSIGPGDGTI